jgi:MioC protein
MSSGPVGIFVATMTGLASVCAEEIEAVLIGAAIETEVLLMDGLPSAAIEPFSMIVIVSSTYGHGDIPDNGQAFFAALAAAPSLTGKTFAVFGLGDRTYMDTFCHAGEQWDALLQAKGAKRLTPLERHDASGGSLAEDAAGEWAAAWVTALPIAA